MSDRISVPGHLLSGPPGDHFVLRVVGDAMAGEAISDGDFLVIRRGSAVDGDMVIAAIGDERTLKRYYLESDRVRLDCANGHPPLYYPADQVKVEGVAVGLMRRFR